MELSGSEEAMEPLLRPLAGTALNQIEGLPCDIAQNPLPIGIVGLNFGETILEQLQNEPAKSYFKVAAVCDMDAPKVSQFANQYQVKAFSSLDALLAAPEIPVVGLFTPPVGRAGLLRRIIQAGKDVMTTKPFEMDSGAARQILEEARSMGRIIHLNSPPPRLSGYMMKIRHWREKYSLGPPVYCRGEVVASYREKADGRWLDDPQKCPAAPLFRLGIYVVNDLVRLFGEVREVQVQTSRLFTERPTADNAQLGMLFSNGAIGNIFASFCVDNGQYYANSLILHYERGSIYRNMCPFDYAQAEGYSHLRLVTTDRKGKVLTEEWEEPEGSGGYQWREFYEAIYKRDVASMPIDDTVRAIQVIEAMARAENSHQTERVQE